MEGLTEGLRDWEEPNRPSQATKPNPPSRRTCMTRGGKGLRDRDAEQAGQATKPSPPNPRTCMAIVFYTFASTRPTLALAWP